MKILFVSQYFYPEIFKGNDIVFDFIKRGHEVTVLTGKPNYPKGVFFEGYTFFNKKKEIIRGAEIIRVPIYPRKNGKGVNLVINYLSFIFFSYFACLFRVKGRFDIIFIQQFSPVTMALPGIWLKKKNNTPVYLWVLDLWPDSILAASNFKNKLIINIVEKLVKYIYNSADVILISSNNFKDSILTRINNFTKEIIYFPNWAEDIFSSISLTSNVELPLGYNIMFAGNVGESQDFETIIKAAELTKHDQINWIVLGDGRKMKWVKSEINKKNVNNVHILGRFEIESMPSFFKKADAMLVTLKDKPVFALTVPAKIQAYMASGKIILGALNGEGNLIINESKSGIAVQAGDHNSLANKAIHLKNMSKVDKNMMEKNAINYYKDNFNKKTLFDMLEKNMFDRINSKNE
jgi:glycosyltransferase involved in cell wall biosynthesis